MWDQRLTSSFHADRRRHAARPSSTEDGRPVLVPRRRSARWRGIALAWRSRRNTRHSPPAAMVLKVLLADSEATRAAAVEHSLAELGNVAIVHLAPGCSIHDAVIAEAP